MNFTPIVLTIEELLGGKKQFFIPRFQRTFSWDKKNYEELLVDLLDNISLDGEKFVLNKYFLGTMLFMEEQNNNKKVMIVDGQQRLTTITIIFAVLAEYFQICNKEVWAKNIFKYIMTSDNDGNEFRVLRTQTSHPYFANFIQDFNKQRSDLDASTEEEKGIKQAYAFFKKKLEKNNLLKYLNVKIKLSQ